MIYLTLSIVLFIFSMWCLSMSDKEKRSSISSRWFFIGTYALILSLFVVAIMLFYLLG
jgi:hypothetical protein